MLPPPLESFERFFRENFRVIQRKCARMLGDPEAAADVSQETFLRLCAAGLGEADPRVRAVWIYRTSTRLAIDQLRRRRLGIEISAEAAAPAMEAATTVRADDVLDARQWLAAIASSVPQKELAVAVLTRLDGMTPAEVAEVNGCSERTVRRILARFDARVDRLGRRM